MGRPPKKERSLAEVLEDLKAKGVLPGPEHKVEEDPLESLTERIRRMLAILQHAPMKATEMTYLVMYDISDHRVRTAVAKYLKRQGCVRIQRSVFLARSENKRFRDILETLREINGYYENKDSIILVPVNASDARSMKLIGQNVDLDTLIDPPGTLFV